MEMVLLLCCNLEAVRLRVILCLDRAENLLKAQSSSHAGMATLGQDSPIGLSHHDKLIALNAGNAA